MKHFACTLEALTPGKAFITKIKEIEIGIFLQNERVYAVRNMCPHKLAPVCKGTVRGTMLPSEPCEYEFGLDDQVLKCPWHGWEFDLTSGESLFGISNRKVQTYSTSIQNNQVFVEI